jgi:Plant transposon protein
LAFGVLIARFEILQKQFLVWDDSILAEIVDTCIIIHTMIVEERRTTYASQEYVRTENIASNPEEGNYMVSLFQATTITVDNADVTVAEQIANRMAHIDKALKLEIENASLHCDLIETLWEQHNAK